MTPAPAAQGPLLAVRDLRIAFAGRGREVQVVNGLSYALAPGEALGIVGESGSGKSVSAAALIGLLGPTARIRGGSAIFEGTDLLRLSPKRLRRIRGGRIGMVFQDPLSSLNPVLPIGLQIGEALAAHSAIVARQREARILELLALVGIPEPKRVAAGYPHQLSGGMRQRVMIAIAVACRPALLIADEPTTALDVTIQAQILDLFRSLREKTGTALLLITHDLGIVAGTTDRVAVMYAGRVVETGPTRLVLARPRHPYTRGLLRSIPRLDLPRSQKLHPIEGSPPDPARPVGGCPFQPRCPIREARCGAPVELTAMEDGTAVACWVTGSQTPAFEAARDPAA